MDQRGIDLPTGDQTALGTLSLLSQKWHPVVILILERNGPMGFSDLLEMLPDISGKVLSETLEALQDAGLVERNVLSESPLRVEYELTDAGADLQPVFEALSAWGERYLEQTTPRILLVDADRRITEMYAQWLTNRYTVSRAHNDEELEEQLDETIDVLLADERLPGTALSDAIGNTDGTCRILVLVGDRPRLDLLDLECDDILRKPIVQETALESIDEQLSRQGEPAERRELESIRTRLRLFESIYSADRLESTDSYDELRTRLESLEETAETLEES